MPSSHKPRGRPKSFHDKTEATRIQALDRALDVLDQLASGGGQTLSELAAVLDQSPATVYRILTTFAARGMAETDPADQTWHVGANAFRTGSAFLRRSSLVERARPVMRRLMEETGETANLGVERGDQVLFLSQVETHETIRAFFPPGTLSPLHSSGIGKALLSVAPATRIDLLMTQNPEAFTPNTITDAAAMHANLTEARARGFAHDDEERTIGMRCLAAPILNLHGEAVAGISVSGPTHRLTNAHITDIGTKVAEAAKDLSRALGAAV
ncbi:HTH-type transcriptional regulator BhcR [Shimia biformata]|uniref:HTH-type transcriptional regulator BhcR n=1 Tax=Shimia biformata TaxID=1294299 RepID=UPI00195145C5|nr:HTH-type transcriptional regulator BhcR [Shimia biformata]